MDYPSALEIATTIIQIIDLTGKVVSRSKERHHAANRMLVTVTVLEQAANQLQKTSAELISDSPDWSKEDIRYLKPMSAAKRQLLQLN